MGSCFFFQSNTIQEVQFESQIDELTGLSESTALHRSLEFTCSPCDGIGFVPQSKNMQFVLTGDSKLSVSVYVCVNVCLSQLCHKLVTCTESTTGLVQCL